jgi:hypothetical protein
MRGHHFFGSLVQLIVSLLLSVSLNQAHAVFSMNGFDLGDTSIDADEIHHGGPVKDGIPAIDKPKFLSAAEAKFLRDDDRILGLTIHGQSKAYPVRILNYHEIVNDFLADQAVVITYCPLCGSGMAFDANIKGENTTFGVSGLLYNSDVLLYDRQTQSLWSQLLGEAISGTRKGTALKQLVMSHTSWSDWSRQYPDTQVLTTETGYRRDYTQSPYGGYEKSSSLYFSVESLNTRYHPKEYVVGLSIEGKHKVYPFAELAKQLSPLKDTFMGQNLTIIFDAQHRTVKILGSNNKEIPSTMSFWFAWMAFYPDSQVFQQ